MEDHEAREFIAGAVGASGGVWADVGAGTGTFTRALRSVLHPGSRIYAIDKNPAAITALRTIGDGVIPIKVDFTGPLTLPEPDPSPLDGILLANALHFLPDAAEVLARLVRLLKPGGRVVIVEYDRRAASRWVPYPIGSAEWPAIAKKAGLQNWSVTSRRKSAYAGDLYVAVAHSPRG